MGWCSVRCHQRYDAGCSGGCFNLTAASWDTLQKGKFSIENGESKAICPWWYFMRPMASVLKSVSVLFSAVLLLYLIYCVAFTRWSEQTIVSSQPASSRWTLVKAKQRALKVHNMGSALRPPDLAFVCMQRIKETFLTIDKELMCVQNKNKNWVFYKLCKYSALMITLGQT